MSFKTLLSKLSLSSSTTGASGSLTKSPHPTSLFPTTNPESDGPECLHDCATCTVKLPSKWKVDEDDKLYGHVDGWSTHLVVATGTSDWVRDVGDIEGSVMRAVQKCGVVPENGRLKVSASNMPLPDDHHHHGHDHHDRSKEIATSAILLPAFTLIENITPSSVPDLITHFVNPGPTNSMPLDHTPSVYPPLPPTSSMTSRPCPHDYLILLCSHKTRDARCGQSAPLLRKEFERHLRPLDMFRDLDDERPGGCGIYFINHVGGHKYSANVIIYRRNVAKETELEKRTEALHAKAAETNGHAETNGEHKEEAAQQEPLREAAQCIWLARVRPEDCENIIRYTVLQGKVVKPDRQLRGGFDRETGLASW